MSVGLQAFEHFDDLGVDDISACAVGGPGAVEVFEHPLHVAVYYFCAFHGCCRVEVVLLWGGDWTRKC